MQSQKNNETLRESDTITLLDNVNQAGIFNKLEIFQKLGEEAEPTDLAIITGAYRDGLGFTPYWTKTSGLNYIAVIASLEYSVDKHYEAGRYATTPAFRPAFTKSSITNPKNLVQNPNNPLEFTYGEYPRTVETDEDKIIELERLERLNKTYFVTNKKYSFDGKKFSKEYVLNGEKYVKVVAHNDEEVTLSNGKLVEDGKVYWVKVEPITWIYDKATDLLISKYALLSGIPYWTIDDEADYSKSNAYLYLKEHMAQDLFTVSDIRKVNDYTTFLTNNIFGLDDSYKTASQDLSELVSSNISVFLHGDTGVGKSDRVEQFDSDATIIYLCAETLDSLTGKSVYIPPIVKKVNGNYEVVEPGHLEEVKPSWLEELERKCAAEPDKLHALFFDEITNAAPAIQSFCFNIILNHDVNGIWTLPENARVVAAGNEIDDSLSANELAEPLFDRFGHIYISDNVKEWLAWAVNKNIHPAVIAFMSATNGFNLRTKYDGLKPNADPRKWEMVSKVLYQKKNIGLLKALIGEDLMKSFAAFCKSQTITLEDVLNGNYNESVFNMDTNQKYVCALTLSAVSMEDFEIAYEFMEKVGDEPCAVFESIWARDDYERLEKIKEIKDGKRSEHEAKRAKILERKRESQAQMIAKALEQQANKGAK